MSAFEPIGNDKGKDTDLPITWKQINWRKVEREVYKLQKRIYQASNRGDKSTMRKLQKLLSKSWYAKLLATRQVTQDNQGKKTAGVDGVKSLTPEQRMETAKSLKLDGKAQPARRVWVPKPGKDERRPLGIPVMTDRVKQALAKLVLEPEWEAKFEPNSYGFRPGRSCHDAFLGNIPKHQVQTQMGIRCRYRQMLRQNKPRVAVEESGHLPANVQANKGLVESRGTR